VVSKGSKTKGFIFMY